ncbi:MAG TPA: hypothetical protein VHY91_24305 [Pirellulales bacterium]|nr:hypothetical protein [Pirellulales bacterium]
MPGNLPGLVHVVTPQLSEGEHKKQAVRLFVAALEILHRQSVDSLLLQEVSRLHQHLARAVGRDPYPYSACGRADRLLRPTSALSLCPSVQLHLCQAGFCIAPREFVSRLERGECTRLRRGLISATDRSIREAAAAW